MLLQSSPQYFLDGGPNQRHVQSLEASRPHHQARTDSSEEQGSPDPHTPRYEGRTDAFFFPPNAVSPQAVQGRRDKLSRSSDGYTGRSPPQRDDVVVAREGKARRHH